jgi:hydroxymethylpyrimidine/phosphomethylpyrimidine kinase
MPLASLITPNLSEAEVLTEHRIGYVDEMKAAASELLKFGCGSVLLKGGHLEGDKMCDVLQTAGEDKPHLFISDKIESKNTHGTGCTLSSASARHHGMPSVWIRKVPTTELAQLTDLFINS